MTAEGSNIIMLLNSFQQIHLSTEVPLGLLLLCSQRIRVNSSLSLMEEHKVTVGKLYLKYKWVCVSIWIPYFMKSFNWVYWRWVTWPEKWMRKQGALGVLFSNIFFFLFNELNSLLAEKSQPWFFLASL